MAMQSKQQMADKAAANIKIQGLSAAQAAYMFSCLRKDELVKVLQFNGLWNFDTDKACNQ